MKVLFIPTGPIEWNTPRLRCYWVTEMWDEAETWDGTGESWSEILSGVEVLVVQQKFWRDELREPVRLARVRGIPIIWDACDPGWWWEPRAREMAEKADFIVASTDNLAALAREELNKPAICIPDRHKIDAYAVKKHEETDCPTLMWHGWRASHASLWNCSAELTRLAAMGLRFKVMIVDDTGKIVPEALTQWNYGGRVDVELVKWEYPKFFEEQIVRADVGLVPPYPGVWSKYKSNNKTVAFWCAGIPTTKGDDIDQMIQLITNWELRKELGKRYREIAIRDWAIEKSVEEWRRLINLIGG